VIHEHLLVPDPHGPVVLRDAPIPVPSPPPVLLVAMDLYDSGEPRSQTRAIHLIQENPPRGDHEPDLDDLT
jgi:hypothetical protein